MPETLHDLVADPVFTVRRSDGRKSALPIPGVLAALGADEIESFRALQLHQEHAWHAFLVQLAAIALHRAGRNDPVQDEETWREMLLALTGGDAAAWCLMVSDLARPAFMQPPVPEKTLRGWKLVAFPDGQGMDLLVTAKNHDVKTNRIARAEREHWAYALVALQTMQGYSGKFNYGIARMNSGYGNRPAVAYAPSLAWGPRFRRDAMVLLRRRDEITEIYPSRGGKALLWLEPWDGKTSLPVAACDPYFIEVCRRIRLAIERGRLVAYRATSTVARLAADELKGNTGDPWTPVERTEAKALTVQPGGFSYRLMQELLFGDRFRPGPALHFVEADGESPLAVAWALVRGDGDTGGMYSRTLPIPPRVRRRLALPDGREHLARLAVERVHRAADMQAKVLRPALRMLLQGGPETPKLDDDRPRRWIEQFDRDVDTVFFSRLWEALDLDVDAARRRWAEELHTLARRRFEHAIQSAPLPEARRYRAIAAADRVFGGALHRHFSELHAPAVEEARQP